MRETCTVGALLDFIQDAMAAGRLTENSPVVLTDMAGDEADEVVLLDDNGILNLQADEA